MTTPAQPTSSVPPTVAPLRLAFRERFAHLAWPSAYAGTFGIAIWCRVQGFDHLTAVMLATAALALVLWTAERFWPHRLDWQIADDQLVADMLHLLIGFNLGSALATFGATWLFTGTGAWLNAHQPVWPSAWPMYAQVALALVVGDLGNYWQHRWVHRVPLFWRFHALHHNPRRLVLLKTTRIHALDIATGSFLLLAPVVMLGAAPDVVLWLTLFTNVSALLQHVNVRIPTLRFIDTVFSTPKNHRSHHSRDLLEGNLNFSMNVMLYDHIFGSYHAAQAEAPAQVGINGDDGRGSFIGQCLAPFVSRRGQGVRTT